MKVRGTHSLHNKPKNKTIYSFPDILMGGAEEQHPEKNASGEFKPYKFGSKKLETVNTSDGNDEAFEFNEYELEEIRKLEKNAFSQGFLQGEKTGIEAEKLKSEPMLQNFQQAIIELDNAKKHMYLKAEKETVLLALAIAKKIIGHEVLNNQELVLKNVIKDALKRASDQSQIKVRIHPSDYSMIEKSKSQFSQYIDNKGDIVFEVDERIHNGGCIIETDSGEIDARIGNQLMIVEEALKSQIQKETPNG